MYSPLGCGWQVTQMLADEIGLHKRDAFQLIVVDSLDKCELWWTKRFGAKVLLGFGGRAMYEHCGLHG